LVALNPELVSSSIGKLGFEAEVKGREKLCVTYFSLLHLLLLLLLLFLLCGCSLGFLTCVLVALEMILKEF
jgi:hypothetical protein